MEVLIDELRRAREQLDQARERVSELREQIAAAVHVIIQAQRLRDGSRKITHVTEVIGMEGDIITLQDLYVYEIEGEDENGKIVGEHRSTGLRPSFWDKARYFGQEPKLARAMGMTAGTGTI